MIARRLFWKIYLTLLASLVAVTLLTGGLWWLLGDAQRDRPDAFRVDLSGTLLTAPGQGGTVSEAVRRLGDEADADMSLYDGDGLLLAARGVPIAERADAPRSFSPVMRIDLPDRRILLVRVRPPQARRLMALVTAMIVVVGGVALAAFPVTARLTRRLETLRAGMARWGRGDIGARVDGSGSDEVASVARTFNAAAERVAALLASERALLTNASHELRSPLARLRIAVDLWQSSPDVAGRDEIVRNLGELDDLVAGILLSSRLEHPGSTAGRVDMVDLLGVAAEEAARTGAQLDGEPVEIEGDEMLLRRLMRNLLENAVKHGRQPVRVSVLRQGRDARIVVSDEGSGIPADERERVFEPFYRPAGHGEGDGGWGLGLSLVRQIALRHGGRVACEGGAASRGSRFVVVLPMSGARGASSPDHPAPHS